MQPKKNTILYSNDTGGGAGGAPPPESGNTLTAAPTQTGTTGQQLPKSYTEAELNQAHEAAREQEKTKLYNRMASLEGELSTFKERDAQAQKDREEQAAREAELRKKQEEAELSAKEILERRESEWTQQLATVQSNFEARMGEMEQARQASEALLEKEREYQRVSTYLSNRLTEEADNIAPQLVDYVGGNTPEEIEASIATAKEKTLAILNEIAVAQQGRPRSVLATAPAVPGMENQTGTQQITAEDIRNMPMEQYGQNRQALLAAASRARRASY